MTVHEAKHTRRYLRKQRKAGKPKAGAGKIALRITIVVVLGFIALAVIGNFLPAHNQTGTEGSPRTSELYTYSVNVSPAGTQPPFTTSKAHITALVKTAPDGTQSVLLVNTGLAPASAVFTFPELHINRVTATVHNVWTGTTATVGGIKVTLKPGATALYNLK
jgi:hypothetical protein